MTQFQLPHLHFTSLATHVMSDIVETYRIAAENLGYPTSYAHACVQPGVINIIFFVRDLQWEELALLHPDCIVVNFEVMQPGFSAWQDNYLYTLKQCYLWDYSRSNLQSEKVLGLKIADYVPFSYEAGAGPVIPFTEVLPDAQQDIDVVFFGAITQRRRDILDALVKRGLRVSFTDKGSWSAEQRDNYLRRAKVALNISSYDNSRTVESPRLSVFFRYHKAIVCELYPDSEIDPDLRPAVVGAPYDQLVDTVLALLADAPRRASIERVGLAIFSRRSQSESVGPALEHFRAWRTQQPDRTAASAQAASKKLVSVCIVIEDSFDGLGETLAAIAIQSEHAVELIVVMPESFTDAEAIISGAGLSKFRIVALPISYTKPVARNIALELCNGDYIVFCNPGDVDLPGRLLRQTTLLEANSNIDIAGSWIQNELDPEPVRLGELHHQFLADLLGTRPLPLSAFMFRRNFIARAGVRYDPEFTFGDSLQFLCRCATAGARFAVVPEVLHNLGRDKIGVGHKPEQVAAQSMRSRALLLSSLFAKCTYENVQTMTELYAHMWPSEVNFAADLLETLARVCASGDKPGLGSEHQTLVRALRHEALRLLHVFFNAGLINQSWIDQQFLNCTTADFLAPAAAELPLRPSSGR
ncbi:Glycosyl transferase family 2 [Collimonas sp. OK307]|uniref:glycosyltransferase family 2 protein n=1 Tax=Collimonas sp. OK307 TaxID=1801620 RepID=UPI0008EF15A7|nr:glycosyltransferase [Collimonas sp. OK307]SFH71550.1 Glycosyl transferase family 2 [Collimonas sp. OK307]